jgi:hypothetical protein
VVERDCEVLEVFGASLQFLIAPQSRDETPCVLKGMIPPGVREPIHSHAGIEAFFVLLGDVEVLTDEGRKARWTRLVPGISLKFPARQSTVSGIGRNIRSFN